MPPFTRDTTAGQGFIALAALIFSKWHPIPVMMACLLFSFLDAIVIRLQGRDLLGIDEMPVQFIEVTPYILTVILLGDLLPHSFGSEFVI